MTLILRNERGESYDLLTLTRLDVLPGHLARRLAQINRYAGAIRHPYSVAMHSVLVSLLCPADEAWGGLTHDLTEALVGDVLGPIKHQCWMWGYRRLERKVRTQLHTLLDIPADESPAVRAADKRAFELESWYFRGLLPDRPVSMHEAELTKSMCKETSWRTAQDVFLTRWREVRNVHQS